VCQTLLRVCCDLRSLSNPFAKDISPTDFSMVTVANLQVASSCRVRFACHSRFVCLFIANDQAFEGRFVLGSRSGSIVTHLGVILFQRQIYLSLRIWMSSVQLWRRRCLCRRLAERQEAGRAWRVLLWQQRPGVVGRSGVSSLQPTAVFLLFCSAQTRIITLFFSSCTYCSDMKAVLPTVCAKATVN
jgi:hypothetical protein